MRKFAVIIFLVIMGTHLYGQEITIAPTVTMLALGDSYTIGESVDVSERWPHQFAAELRNLGVTAADPDYIATTGWTTRRLIQGIGTYHEEEKAYNLVSILIGVNNQYQGIDITQYEPDLREIINLALEIARQDTSRVFILSIPDYAYTPFGRGNETISKEIDQYNSIKKRVAVEYGIAYIDITPISRGGLTDPSLVARDGLHPSGEQYRRWVQEILPRLYLEGPLTSRDMPGSTRPSLTVFPNPATTLVHLDSPVALSRIRIWNATAALVSEIKINSLPAHLDISHLSPGIYTLEGVTEGHGSQESIRARLIKT